MTQRQRPQTVRSGFSLFEILVVVSALAILAAVALPTLHSVEAQSLESTARVVAADLRLARHEAVQHNTSYTVRFDSARNSYELVHTGTGTPPALRNASAGGGTADGEYRVELDRFGPTTAQTSGVRYAGAMLENSKQSVNDITFGPRGGTGPARSEDTVLWLNSGSGSTTKSIRLTISWITGQVWIDSVAAKSSAIQPVGGWALD